MSLAAASEKGSDTTVDEFNTPEDKALVRKIDLRLIPILTLLYLLSFLDRTNIGNAKIVGLTTDLNVTPPEYNTALALYFVAYVIFEVPANIILKRFDPQIWLPSLTLVWGIVSICQGLIVNKAGLFGIRFLLGVTEAGLFPGVIYVFSVYYRRHERSWRVAIFFGGAALAGAFGGILAYAIGKMDGIGGRKGWEWIFILEGSLTVAVSLLAYFIVPTWSHKAKFLTESEKRRLYQRLNADSDAALVESFEWKYVRQAFTDHLVWGYAFLFHGFAFVLYSLSLFLPTIIAGLGFQSWQAQLLTVPPNALAAISIWTTVWVSAKVNLRAPFIIGAALVAIIGYIILLTTNTAAAQYVGVHFAAAGVYTGNALLLSWPGENVSAQTKRAVAVAMQITIGDIGAIAGVLIYRPNLAAHRFRTPHIIAIGYLLFSVIVALYLSIWMNRENKRRDSIVGGKQIEASTPEERQILGDRDVHYRYVT
ncbi:major facilitator superfamily domain-containing protein [Crassisporium funariophilum]|nr:major facilitator superfamily domain-containing protein [Crassisporium funariophilum]